MDVADPFITFYRDNPDYNPSDERAEAQMLLDRQTFLEKVLKGEESLDDFLDLLEAQDYDPAAYLQNTTDELNYVVDNGIPFTSNETGILLPTYLR